MPFEIWLITTPNFYYILIFQILICVNIPIVNMLTRKNADNIEQNNKLQQFNFIILLFYATPKGISKHNRNESNSRA